MALIVEDGTGLADAESYLSVADAAAYHAKMGNSVAWAAIADAEAMLRRATNYLRGRYFSMWVGDASVSSQRLDWPRIGAATRNGAQVGSTVVPQEVKDACADLALKAATSDLMPDASQTVKREKVGPIEVEYQAGSVASVEFTAIDAMLAPYLKVGAQSKINATLIRG